MSSLSVDDHSRTTNILRNVKSALKILFYQHLLKKYNLTIDFQREKKNAFLFFLIHYCYDGSLRMISERKRLVYLCIFKGIF